MLPDEPSDEERLEQLPQDGQTPFRPADPAQDGTVSTDDDQRGDTSGLDDTHPDTDDGIDATELYQEGISGAAEAEEPNNGNTVIEYDADQA